MSDSKALISMGFLGVGLAVVNLGWFWEVFFVLLNLGFCVWLWGIICKWMSVFIWVCMMN